MSEEAVQIVARGLRREAEAAAEAIDAIPGLEATTYSILEEDEEREIWRIDAYPTSVEEAEALKRALAGFSGLSVRQERLADADWLAMALSGLPPVRAGRFFVFGRHDLGRAPANAVKLRIEAGAAFGTGHHGTTVGCLLALDRLLKTRRFEKVLDVGCGTGVLAIAAAKTGSRLTLGTDIDPVSVRIARENALVNQAGSRFVHAAGLAHPAVAAAAPYDLIFANILARPLVRLAPGIARAVGPGGRVVLSGLLRSQERFVRAAYLGRGLRLERALRREAWATLVFARR